MTKGLVTMRRCTCAQTCVCTARAVFRHEAPTEKTVPAATAFRGESDVKMHVKESRVTVSLVNSAHWIGSPFWATTKNRTQASKSQQANTNEQSAIEILQSTVAAGALVQNNQREATLLPYQNLYQK